MINPGKLYTYAPFDRTNLKFHTKILIFFIEYFARILGAIYLSISLLFISIMPFKNTSKTFFRVLGNVCDMYRMKWMGDEYYGHKTMEKRDGPKVS